jgi:hypothetical protein
MPTLSVRPRRRQLTASSAAYRLTRTEQETVVRWDRAEEQVHLWSASPVTWRKLARLGIPAGRETRLPGGVVSGRFYTIPLSRFRWGLKRASGPARRLPPRRLTALSGGAHDAA